jgi:hypothetical protein
MTTMNLVRTQQQKAAQLIARAGGPLGFVLWLVSFAVALATLDRKGGPLFHAVVFVGKVTWFLSPWCGAVAALVGIVLASLHMQPWSQVRKQLAWAFAVALLWLLSAVGVSGHTAVQLPQPQVSKSPR